MATERAKAGVGVRWLRALVPFFAASMLGFGCGGSLNANVGGESHFLRACDGSCEEGLECLAGVCTKDCSVNADFCSRFGANASCEQSASGQAASCDAGCDADADCIAFKHAPKCENSHCRGVSGGAGGKSCRVAHRSYPSGSTLPRQLWVDGVNEPGTASCRDCTCLDGELDCKIEPCNAGAPVFECPENVVSDPLTEERVALIGDSISFDVTHGGGCQQHDYALCFRRGFLESSPVRGDLRLIHDAHGDGCEALLSAHLEFDLTPISQAYEEAYGGTSGVVITPYGYYGFGDLSCDDRQLVALAQIGQAVERTNVSCETAADCAEVSVDTSCTASCGAVVADAGSSALRSELASIDAALCGGPAAGCAPVIPPCVPPPPIACVAGVCVAGP